MSPLYHGLSTGKSSVRDHRGPSAHHSSAVDTRIGSHRSDDSVGLFGHDPTVGQSQRGTQSARSILQSYTSTQALTTKNQAQTTRNAHPKAQKKQLLNLLNETSNSRTSRAYGISQLIAPSFQTSINGKSKSQGVQHHQERQKQRLDAMEIGGGKSR
ncbi:hypothetical protein F511_14462 [Dorcoceras hygrometricum]|uniref:Uncharacterized protein n=1 Tax=Dorcoceras hygrometricum TaxID=472368 RepID=A0A2Z7BGX4_9LAMI|nr:hypothetical protein F511_14462 [Dorcoceras hygrometricum]